ncbi:MAG TPA: diguanylate cyclase [Solirubrobacteraceae bacterium]|jgi:diguanylate cyclase (GGDEF)-like protein/putative nucleotidyltransferase with HDIG domain|nr:diguanylate cyclase [Solirubrobacteraceae bacterium]
MFSRGHQDDLLKELEWLRERVRELEAEHARGLRLDSVTGLLSARALRGRLAEECERARRYQRALCVAVLSIDDFEALELRHGFRAGDELVSAFAARLRATTRSHDLIGRTATAEFAVLLPDTDAETALPGLERLLVELELTGEGTIRAAGASLGIAALQRRMSAEGLLASARQALGHSRATGGGRATIAAETDADIDPAKAPQREAIEALAVALLERDRYTGEHSAAVIEMSASVARTLGCNAAEVERVRSAALLHDIGKVAIPDEILHKAGPLNDEEWLLMKQHPVIGERILRVLPGLGPVARMVRHEHERWDGGGYPDGLAGQEIPFGSRVIIVADTYHAITSDRPYRAARAHDVAVDELTRCAGTQFDPEVTAALIGHLYGRRQGGAVSA